MNQNKTSKYLKYAIGEIILVVIGILIALSINNWNEQQKEKKQVRNIYARVVKDFENSTTEIDSILIEMNAQIPLIRRVIREDVDRDSLLTDRGYLRKHIGSTNSYPDIKIHDKGVRMLETKIGLNYELNTEYSETLILLYSAYLYEIEVKRNDLDIFSKRLYVYKANKGIAPFNLVKNGKSRIADMIFEDDVYKNHVIQYLSLYTGYRNKLRRFKTQGEVLINKIKTEYNLE
tara:strand:+ start:5692 stop:6390 length:699 start_codon:yes stop_codon:yes gene_type:complete